MSDLQRRIASLSAEQRALFERKLRERGPQPAPPAASPAREPIRRVRAADGTIPLSFAQERFWFLHQMAHDRGAYNVFIVVKLEGRLDVQALNASLREILRRHDVLRTAIDDSRGQPTAAIDPTATVDVTIVDLRPDGADAAARARSLVIEEIQHRFDLRRAEFLRPVLYRLTDAEQWLAVTLHHVVSDRWSMTVLIRETAALYASFSAGEPSRLAELPSQYADFAAWQRRWFESDDCREQIAYWRRVLGDGVPALQMPFDRPRGPGGAFRGATVTLALSPERMTRVAAFCQREGVTPFMTALTAYALLLRRYSGQPDFAIGTPVANRHDPDTHRLIGCFVNTLALRCRIASTQTCRSLLQQVRETCLGAYSHQDLPFERLVDALDPPRGIGHSPYFQVMFTLNDQHDPASGHAVLATTLAAGGLRLTPLDFDAGHVPTDLLLRADIRPDGLHCSLDHDAALFDGVTAARMLEHFGRVLDAVVTQPDCDIAGVPLLTASERAALLDGGRGPRITYPYASVHAAFSAQARATPDRTAVSLSSTHVTYGELDERSTRFARVLARRGVGPDTTVALFFDRSIELLVSVLAVLKAGAAYVPIDPSYPASRLAYLLRDARVRTVLTQPALAARVPAFDGDVIRVDPDGAAEATREEERESDTWDALPVSLELSVSPDDLAYVMYTSGSTGEPKGVQIPHRGVLRLVLGANYVDLGPDDGILQLASTAFDATTFEVWGALLHGARVVLSPERVLTPLALGELLAAEHITILWLTASLFNTVIDEHPEALRGVRQLLIGGEALSMPHVRRALALLPDTQIINGYGPTETTTFACCYRIPRALPDEWSAMPIGLPISHSSAYVLDERMDPAPIGVPGLLWLGGAGLARGYLCRPALTAETFVPDPFGDAPGARLYRTGDLARVRADGAIDFLGRRDGQLKVRGFRVEAGEVEAALVAHPQIKEAAVVLRALGPDDRRLVAYVVTIDGDALDIDAVRRCARERLPEFEVPSLIVVLPALPRTSTGKLDRRALPDPAERAETSAGTPPRTPLEAVVLAIWQTVLETGPIGVHDDFFTCGGHSLLATRIVSRVRDACGVSLPLRTFFEQPTVAGLAQAIERLRTPDRAEPPPLIRGAGAREGVAREGDERGGGEVAISFAQQRLWFLDRLDPGSNAYVIPVAARLRGALDVDALTRSLDAIVRRHDALRTTFHARDGQPVAFVQPPFVRPGALRLPLADLSRIAVADRDAAVRAEATLEARRPFHLDVDLPIRGRLLRLDAEDHVLLLALHHIAADGWSIAVLLRELAECYDAATTGRDVILPELPVQYADYAAWQRTWLDGDASERQIAYWRTQLHGADTTLRLPIDRPRTASAGPAARRHFRLSRDTSAALATVSRVHGVTPFMTLVAAFQTLLARYTGQTDITIGTPIAGRVRQDVEPLIGLFVNTLALRCDLSGNPRFADLLAQVRDVTLDAYTHQDVPFERVIEAVQPARDLSQSPLFQVVIVFQNTPPVRVALPALRIADLAWDGGRAKFDLTLTLAERDGRITGAVEYRADLFAKATIHRLIRHFQSLLRAASRQPDARLHDLPLGTRAARSTRNRSARTDDRPHAEAVDAPPLLHAWIERQAALTPHRDAIVRGDERVSYATLDRRANALAWRLREAAGGPETRTAIHLDRSTTSIVAMLAVLKSGGAYVLLDADRSPVEAVATIAAARVDTIVTQDRWRDVATAIASRVICVDACDEERVDGPPVQTFAAALACVLPASADAGTPLAVGVTHRSASALVGWTQSLVGPEDLSAALVSMPTAACQFPAMLFAALGSGGAALLAESVLTEPVLTNAAVPVTLIDATPRAIRELLHRGPLPASVRTVILTGDAWTPDLVAQLYAQAGVRRVFARDDVAEASGGGMCVLPPNDGGAPVAIGQADAVMRVCLLDARMETVSWPLPGELALGGVALARGYLNDAALTAARFVPDPHEAGARVFRTGARARYRADAVVEVVDRGGQRDRARGFLAELSEAYVRDHPAVADAFVIAQDASGSRRLVAYVVMHAGQEDASYEIRRFLQPRAPGHMIPGAIVRLARLPRRADGAIDRHALPAVDEPNATRGGPLRTPLEHELGAIWRELLRTDAVARETDFFDAGGHSLLATQLAARVHRDCHVDLPLKVVFTHPTIAALARQIQIARQTAEAPPPDIPRVARDEGGLPLSFGQRRLWFLDRMNPGNPAYNIFLPLSLSGPLDVAALQRALDDVVARHEVLRTSVPMVDGEPLQVVRPATTSALLADDLRELPARHRRSTLDRLMRDEAHRSFDLATGPLCRTRLVRLDETEHVLCWTMHHIIGDGWSLGLLVRDLAAYYNGARSGQAAVLPDLPIHYADYAVWQQQWLSGARLDTLLAYWQRQLPPAAPLDLPADRPRPAAPAFTGARHAFTFERDLHRRLIAFSRSHDVTPFMTLLAALFVLLARRSEQDGIVVGTPIANRTHPLTHDVIGFFVNTLALRGDLSNNPTFRAFLQQVKQTALDAYEHQDLPFERFVETTKQARDERRNPVFDVMLAYQNLPVPEMAFADLDVQTVDIESTLAKFDLLWDLFERDGAFVGRIQYRTDLCDADTVARMSAELRTLIDGILGDADAHVRDLPLLDACEQRLVTAFSAGAPSNDLSHAGSLHAAIDEQAVRTPDAIAVGAGEDSLTYAQLRRRSNALAARLRAAGVRPDASVALWATRTTDTIVSILAIWKAGGAYVPIDPAWPRERINYMLAHIRPTACIGPLPRGAYAPIAGPRVTLGDASHEQDEPPPDGLSDETRGAAAAYIIYTSGSTGRPNGVVVTHGAALNLIAALNETVYRTLRPGVLRVGVNGPWVFDTTIKQLLQLANGHALHVLPDSCRADAAQFLRTVRAHQIDLVDCTPSQARLLMAAGLLDDRSFDALVLLIGGEAIDAALWTALASAADRTYVNLYGPTECTVDATVAHITASAGEPTIGRPLPNVRTYVLDRRLHQSPIGVPGEAWIAGAGLARGYLRDPALTADRFRPDPFPDDPGARMYRTGDRVRCRATGELEYLERTDAALKIRGFRIEPREVEAALARHPAVQGAAVTAHEYGQASTDARLVAYVTLKDGVRATAAELRRFLRARLPAHLVPAAYVTLAAFPLTTHGKLDRRALPPPERRRDGSGADANAWDEEMPVDGAPRDIIEWQLAEIWAALLDVKDISVGADFFELGGHSLLAMVMLGRVKKALGCDVSLATLFQGATIEQLAAHIRARAAEDADASLAPIRRTGARLPFFCVHPVGGHVLCYLDLARALGADQPFYGLQAPRGRAGEPGGHDPGTGPRMEPGIEQMAARYLDAIRTVQPRGPYALGGWSLGGTIAFEIARLLHAAGEEVALLALIDSHATHPSRATPLPDRVLLRRFAEDLFITRPDAIHVFDDAIQDMSGAMSLDAADVDVAFDALHARAAAAGLLPPDTDVKQLRALFETFRANLRAERRYHPEPSPARVLLIQAADSFDGATDAAFGWEPLARGGIERCMLPGNHDSLLRRPAVDAVASELGRRLAGDDAPSAAASTSESVSAPASSYPSVSSPVAVPVSSPAVVPASPTTALAAADHEA